MDIMYLTLILDFDWIFTKIVKSSCSNFIINFTFAIFACASNILILMKGGIYRGSLKIRIYKNTFYYNRYRTHAGDTLSEENFAMISR